MHLTNHNRKYITIHLTNHNLEICYNANMNYITVQTNHTWNLKNIQFKNSDYSKRESVGSYPSKFKPNSFANESARARF